MSPKSSPRSKHPHTISSQVMNLFQAASSLVAILDPDELFVTLLARVVEALPAVHGGVLWIADPKSGRLRASATAGLPLDAPGRQILLSAALRSGEGAAGMVFLRDEPRIVETRLGYRDILGNLPPASATLFQQISEQLPRRLVCACVPMRVGSEVIGVLELLTLGNPVEMPDGRAIEVEDLPMLQIFANLAASAIKNAQLYHQAQRSERRLKAFDAVVTAISTAADLCDLVHSVLHVVMGLIDETSGAILLLDPAHDRLDLGAQHNLPAACVEVLKRVPVAISPCEEVVHFGQPMLRPLLEERGEAAFLDAGFQGCAYFPLLAGGTVAGVLALYGDADLPIHADREMILPICNQVGFAVANVRLYADSSSERRKLHTVVTSIAEGVLLCDGRGRLTLANEAALTLLRLDSLPFEQRLADMPDFYRMRDLDGHRLTLDQLPFARALAGEIFQDYRLMLSGSSGDETVMSFSGAPARADDGQIEGAVVVFRDVTTHQKLEQAKDEFLAVAAHELRSPLAAVRNYADLLLRREQQRSQADSRDVRGLTILTQQVSHMLRMVDNLLDVSRIDAGQLDLQLQPVNLVALVNQVIDQQRPAAGTRELILEYPDTELLIACDSLRIHQVMTNLINNAIKYSPEGGRVSVRLRVVLGEERHIFADQPSAEVEALLQRSAEHGLVVITITDEGGGITPEQQARLFERFYRARSQRAEGLGLGLYLSRQFVQMHGGVIWVESVEGAGSTFAFALPIRV
ncbi:PAS sensor protein [Oscillochloris trichoides DG-6]|uniref:histidine kinase n=1 Tax=Oscillochloris trichoides DG-6 TaxID=765420 RepID=E1ICL1_9CHLR|nr:ATP-binding protein [Oscillochloris trichoides]EFO81078.1 PAS sensor protein [Oscillochloris trichoides DG-6]